jgi:hypothetical protein
MGATEILNLREAFDAKQSEAIARFFDSNAATKRDVEEVRLEIGRLRSEVNGEIEKPRFELKGEIEKLRFELKSDFEKMRADLADKMLRYQIGGVISIAIILGALRYLG